MQIRQVAAENDIKYNILVSLVNYFLDIYCEDPTSQFLMVWIMKTIKEGQQIKVISFI